MEWVYMWSNPEAIVKCPLQLNFFLLWHIRLNLSDLQKISKYKNKNCDWEQARDMAITEQALSFNICTFSREYKEWKWSLLIFMWREIGFFNNDQVINHFKEHLF